jgi:hypothetical protein
VYSPAGGNPSAISQDLGFRVSSCPAQPSGCGGQPLRFGPHQPPVDWSPPAHSLHPPPNICIAPMARRGRRIVTAPSEEKDSPPSLMGEWYRPVLPVRLRDVAHSPRITPGGLASDAVLSPSVLPFAYKLCSPSYLRLHLRLACRRGLLVAYDLRPTSQEATISPVLSRLPLQNLIGFVSRCKLLSCSLFPLASRSTIAYFRRFLVIAPLQRFRLT